MSEDTNLKIVQDTSLLYELSLAVSSSLNPLENCLKFLNILVGRKNLTYGSVWLRPQPNQAMRLFCATPKREFLQHEISVGHFIEKQLKHRSFISLSNSDPNFSQLIQEKNIVNGTFAIFGLGKLGILKLYCASRKNAFSKMEMSQLEAVIHAFTISMEGSQAFQQLQKESQERLKIQKELQKSNDRFHDLFENMTDALVIIDDQGYILEANKAAKEMALIDQLPAPNFWQLVLPEEIENTKVALRKLVQTGHAIDFETRIIIPGGQIKHIHVNSSGIFEGNRLVGSRSIVRDISLQKRAESALLESQVRLNELIRNIQSGILLEDEQRKIVFVNQFFCDIFRVVGPPSSIIGVDCSVSIEKSKGIFKEPDVHIERVNTLLKNRVLVVGDEVEMADGRILERDYIPLHLEGKDLGHLWHFRDLTEKRRAEGALRKSEEKYRGIIESMELGLMEVDTEDRIKRAYAPFCDMTGYKEEELIGKNATEIFIPEDQKHLMHKQKANRLKGKAGIYEIQARKKDGSLIWVLVSGAPLIDANGKVVGSLGIHYDITKRKILERALAQAKQQAEQARLAEQQFLANMSHEIRTPMNAVIGMTHLLYDTLINEQQKEYLDSLRFSADTLLGVINNILDLSKIEAGELEIEEKSFNLLQLSQALKRTFQFKLKDKPVSLTLEYDDRIKNLVVADPIRINQILTNLLANASKFTFSGTVELRVILKTQSKQQYLIRFEVHDTGIGIPTDKIDSIFQNFKQADVKVTREFGGTGLGLAIVKQLTEIMKGTIEAKSEEGLGSVFVVELPVGDSGIVAVEQKTYQDQINWKEKQFLASLKVLVVEDNTMNQKVISEILNTWGCQYQITFNAQEALHYASEQHYDLILMDIHMPGMDGCETTRRIRSDNANPNQEKTIIALSAVALLEEKNRALEAGLNAFLAKPFSPRNLRTLVLQQMNFQSDDLQTLQPLPSDNTSTIVVDLSYLFELSGGDHFFVRDMIETFLNETSGALQEIRTLLENQNWTPLQRCIHSLKPNLMMLGMKQQEEMAAEVEKILKSQHHDLNDLNALLTQLIDDVQASFVLLKSKLDEL